MTDLTPAIVFCDGSHDAVTWAGGWGAVILWRCHRWQVGGGVRCKTAQRAERHAIVMALHAIPNGHPTYVFSDARSVVERLRERMRGHNVWLAWKRADCPDHRLAHHLARGNMILLRDQLSRFHAELRA